MALSDSDRDKLAQEFLKRDSVETKRRVGTRGYNPRDPSDTFFRRGIARPIKSRPIPTNSDRYGGPSGRINQNFGVQPTGRMNYMSAPANRIKGESIQQPESVSAQGIDSKPMPTSSSRYGGPLRGTPGMFKTEMQSLLDKILQDKKSPYYTQAQSLMNTMGQRFTAPTTLRGSDVMADGLQSSDKILQEQYNPNQLNVPTNPSGRDASRKYYSPSPQMSGYRREIFPNRLRSTERRIARQPMPNNLNAPINTTGTRPPRGYSAPRTTSGTVQTPSRFYSPRQQRQVPVQYASPRRQKYSGVIARSRPVGGN